MRRRLALFFGLALIAAVGLFLAFRSTRNVSATAPQAGVHSHDAQPAQPSANPLLGFWQVSAVAGASPITAMDGASAARLVGQTVTFGEHNFHFSDQSCEASYERSKESSAEFIQNYSVDPATLHLSAPVTRIDGGCADIFVLGTDKILFTWQGYFLEASRMDGAE